MITAFVDEMVELDHAESTVYGGIYSTGFDAVEDIARPPDSGGIWTNEVGLVTRRAKKGFRLRSGPGAGWERARAQQGWQRSQGSGDEMRL